MRCTQWVQHRFTKSYRLLSAADYRRVFDRPGKSADKLFTVLWRPNQQETARLGLVVAKKNVKLAVHRNQIKRLIRESFRTRRTCLQGVDVVVLARRGVHLCTKRKLMQSMNSHWDRLIQQYSASCPEKTIITRSDQV